jgi:hypothetical protein
MTMDDGADIGPAAIDGGVQMHFHGRRVRARLALPVGVDRHQVGIGQAAAHRSPAVDQRAGFLADAGVAIEIDDAVGLQDSQGGQQIAARLGFGHGFWPAP